MTNAPVLSQEFFYARQPIFDRNKCPCAYELLFRKNANSVKADHVDADLATLEMIAEGFVLSQNNGSTKPVFINFTKNMLLEDHALALPAGKCVIEILEDIEPCPEVIACLKKLKSLGYKLALDDFSGSKACIPFLKIVDIIKVDILALNNDLKKIRGLAEILKRFDCQLLAEKVEQPEMFQAVRDLGYSLFQGYFFNKPEIMRGRRISSSEIAKLRLLKELGNPDFDVRQLTRILYSDSSLTYKLFRYINSVGHGLRIEVRTIERAITLLGQQQLVQWLRVLLLTDLSTSPHTEEIIYNSIQRGKFLELAASLGENREQPEAMFILGMFSLLDALLGTSMESILSQLALDKDIKDALLGLENQHSSWLEMLVAYEEADWAGVKRVADNKRLNKAMLDNAYTQSTDWASKMLGR